MIVFSSSDCRYSFISHGLVNGPVTEYLCSQIFVILTEVICKWSTVLHVFHSFILITSNERYAQLNHDTRRLNEVPPFTITTSFQMN